MQIHLRHISKRFRFEWIFKDVNYEFQKGNSYAILGPNGSGKSTFLKVLSGHLTPSKGKITFFENDRKIEIDRVYRHISYCGPYIDLIEEFTLLEALLFHQKFKPFLNNITLENLTELLNFPKSKNKEIRYFSSGMKQRLKLLLTICSDSSVLLLDEPTTNLDRQGIDWYSQLIDQFGKGRLIVVASNVPVDYDFCEKQLNISDYK